MNICLIWWNIEFCRLNLNTTSWRTCDDQLDALLEVHRGDLTLEQAAVRPAHLLQDDGEVSLHLRSGNHSTFVVLVLWGEVRDALDGVQHHVIVLVSPVVGHLLWQRAVLSVDARQQYVVSFVNFDLVLAAHWENKQLPVTTTVWWSIQMFCLPSQTQHNSTETHTHTHTVQVDFMIRLIWSLQLWMVSLRSFLFRSVRVWFE